MLSLQLKSGEYLTIGEDIAVQVFQQPGSSIRVEVKAPRELPILRGSLRERDGGGRPEGLYEHSPVKPSRRARNDRNREAFARRKARDAAALREMREALDRIASRDPGCQEDLQLLWDGLEAFEARRTDGAAG